MQRAARADHRLPEEQNAGCDIVVDDVRLLDEQVDSLFDVEFPLLQRIESSYRSLQYFIALKPAGGTASQRTMPPCSPSTLHVKP